MKTAFAASLPLSDKTNCSCPSVQPRAAVPSNRASHFWDGSGALGKQYGKVIRLPDGKKFAWEVYFFISPKAQWTATPPAPAYWVHQLGGPETGNPLDCGKFREAIVKQLP